MKKCTWFLYFLPVLAFGIPQLYQSDVILKGQPVQLSHEFSGEVVQADKVLAEQLHDAFNRPSDLMRQTLTPKLEKIITQLNEHFKDIYPPIESIESAVHSQEITPALGLFWQAYSELEAEAFAQYGIESCPNKNIQGPCLKPKYANIVSKSTPWLKPLAQQVAIENDPLATIGNIMQWLYNIQPHDEIDSSFQTPLTTLLTQKADSDEFAILMASMLNAVVPQYNMFLLYPLSSNNSVSPAWLVISAEAEVPGYQIELEGKNYTVLSGQSDLLNEFIQSDQIVHEHLF